MGKFFESQKTDAAGVVGITLQKLLIFFMFIDALFFIFGYSWFSSLMSLLFHFVVFMGVYRRRTCVLLLYVVFNVIAFILAAVTIVLVVACVVYVSSQPTGQHKWSNGMSNSTYNYTNSYHPTTVYNYLRSWTPAAEEYPVPPHPSNTTAHTVHPTSTPRPKATPIPKPNKPTPNAGQTEMPPTHDETSYDTEDNVAQLSFVVSLFGLVASVILLYFKILSVVLAHKMRKLLLAPALPVSSSQAEKSIEKSQPATPDPTYIPVEMGDDVPLFAPQGFLYQPMTPQADFYPGQVAMMPAPFMYGQQPVYYSYAPVPTNEKH